MQACRVSLLCKVHMIRCSPHCHTLHRCSCSQLLNHDPLVTQPLPVLTTRHHSGARAGGGVQAGRAAQPGRRKLPGGGSRQQRQQRGVLGFPGTWPAGGVGMGCLVSAAAHPAWLPPPLPLLPLLLASSRPDVFPLPCCPAALRSPAWCACVMWRQQRPPPWSAATHSATTAGASTCGARLPVPHVLAQPAADAL